VKQPDLNMDNPLVREEVKKILRFWLDLGVDGFREDVITFISKTPGLPDDKLLPPAAACGTITTARASTNISPNSAGTRWRTTTA
jgi:glycosidase